MATGIVLAAVVVMFLLSGPRGQNRYYPLGFGMILAVLSAVYAVSSGYRPYYALAAVAAAKGFWDYSRWQS